MSDNPFAELLQSFKRGWDTAGKPVIYSSQYVRSRPSFWNPFHTWRDEDERQLRELYDNAKAAFDASVFTEQETLDDFVTAIGVQVCEGTGRDPHDPAIGAMVEATETLLRADFFTFPQMREADWRHLDLSSANALREDLENKLACLRDWKMRLELAMRALTDLWLAILTSLPRNLTISDATPLPGFSVELVSLIDEPHALMAGALSHFIGNDAIQENGLFLPLCRQLYRNVLEASGVFVDPDKPLLTYDTEKPVFPEHCPKEMASLIAERYFHNTPLLYVFTEPVPFELPEAARFEHCHVLGGTGHGKTQCLQYMIHEDLIRAVTDKRLSVVVIDSQGSLIRNLTSIALFNPEEEASLADRLVLIDPSDIKRPPALNLFNPGLERLDSYTPEQREVAFNSLVDIYGRFFGSLLGAELTGKQSAVFRYLARLMLTIEGATIHTLIALMDDTRPFAGHIEKLDPTARRFFEKEFARKGFNATRQQIKDRLYAVLSIPTFDRLFSAPKSKINFFDCLNNGSIILIDTAKGLLKDEGTAIFGRFMLALIEHAISERANIPDEDRNPVFLYMDEAHEYFDDTVETLLVEARKFRCGLTLAHQNLTQLSSRLRQIFMGNTSIKLCGGITDSDARALAPDMRTTPDFLLSMRKHEEHSSTEFALSVRNITPRALKVNVPLGFLESYPTLEPHQRAVLLERNRHTIGYTPIQNEEPLEERVPATTPIPSPLPAPAPSLPIQTPSPSVPTSAPATGHRELQNRIKQAAQKCGFSATIEQQVQGGKGRIDVALTRDDLRIACEVSVTTKLGHERRNIEKCLAAGYDQVWVTSPDVAQLIKLREGLLPTLPDTTRQRVSFLSEDELMAQLAALTTHSSVSQSRVLGYDVNVVHAQISPSQAKDRRARLAAVLVRARQQKTRGG